MTWTIGLLGFAFGMRGNFWNSWEGHFTGGERCPDTRRPISQRQTEAVLLCHAEICRMGNGLTEDSNLPSLYRRPARAAFGRGPGGEPPLGSANPKSPTRHSAPKNIPPEGSLTLDCGDAGEGTFGLVGSPKEKGWEEPAQSFIASRTVLGVQGAPPCRGFGGKAPGERGAAKIPSRSW